MIRRLQQLNKAPQDTHEPLLIVARRSQFAAWRVAAGDAALTEWVVATLDEASKPCPPDALSPRGRQLAGAFAKTLELVTEHAKERSDEALVIAMFLVADIRNRFPQALAALKDAP